MKEPMGLEELTSSKDISALERSAMTERYVPGRNAGVQLHGNDKSWSYGLGLFEASGDGADDINRVAVTGRTTFAPVNTADTLFHLGAGFTQRGDANIDGEQVYNLEVAGKSGPIHAQMEYFDATEAGVDLSGYYLQLGWIMTGESRPYKSGVFKRIEPATESGAWELVSRYEEGDGKYSDIGLGSKDGNQLTIGLNYYANSNLRAGLSYMTGEESDSGLKGNEARARIQYVF
jgi:phosphate-selective porin OprO/OprP